MTEQYVCDVCGETAGTMEAVVAHLQAAHGVEEPGPVGSIKQEGGILTMAHADGEEIVIDLAEWVKETITLENTKPLDVALKQEEYFGDVNTNTLACPICSYDFQHMAAPLLIDGKDRYQARWGGRGDLVVIPMEGECGHNWQVCFGFHKGNTYAFARHGDPHQPDNFTPQQPDLEELARWQEEGGCYATDGCWVEPDGRCEHGQPSWLLALGLI